MMNVLGRSRALAMVNNTTMEKQHSYADDVNLLIDFVTDARI